MRRRDLRLAAVGSLIRHLRVEFDLTAPTALSLIHSQAHACQMVVARGVRMTDKTTVRDLIDFFVPMGLWPKWTISPVTKRAKAAAVAEALR